MMERFGVVTGLSDHTLDNTTAIAAVALGAALIEKHFKLNRRGGGPDDSFSLEPADLVALCAGARTAGTRSAPSTTPGRPAKCRT
jgi:sialic acid synthase SpsE